MLARINESAHRAEMTLRVAAERMETADAGVQDDLRKRGLGSDRESNESAQRGIP